MARSDPGDASDSPGGEPAALDLEAFRRHGHALVDWIADYLAGLDDRPVREPVEPGDIRARLPAAPPERPEPFDELLADLDRVVVPGLSHWQHPGWYAYFPAMSSPPAVLGELAAAGLGVQGMLWSTSPAVTEIEAHVLDWLVDACGLPEHWKTTGPGGGVIQMSASDSTHTALVVARERTRRLTGAPAESQVVYASAESHSSVTKGARVAGFGEVRPVAVDATFALDPDALAAAVESDRRAGLVPSVVCSTIGTTGTTAVDPVAAVAEIARTHDMWHHVDAAYAGSAMICPEFRHHLAGVEAVDSYTFNPHKWLATNFDCSVFWVADRRPLIETLSIVPPYLRDAASASGRVIDYRDWHVPLGRRFRALKLWWVLRSFGLEGLRSLLRRHVGWARDLAGRIDGHPHLETIAPTPFALVSFRHLAGDAATRALVERINASGRAYLTGSEIDGRAYVRVSIGSTWTTARHVDELWELIDTTALSLATPTADGDDHA
ncbi:MAG: aminotransferase class I/II-fold pyridoxal phosphate-dependent enzyme [Actinomyces sp.]|nr:MAG: aminotransferase class I/II-fold pyridoxal phosphate-dependent enzyme [Actinomyces sp.]